MGRVTPRRLIEPARLAGTALLHTQSDERLVDLCRAGNDRAFEAIVARYRRPLLRYCRRILPAERAEDAVQQAFLNAFRAIGATDGAVRQLLNRARTTLRTTATAMTPYELVAWLAARGTSSTPIGERI